MSPLAEAVYEILRGRVGLAEPRLTYAELARQCRDTEAGRDARRTDRRLAARPRRRAAIRLPAARLNARQLWHGQETVPQREETVPQRSKLAG